MNQALQPLKLGVIREGKVPPDFRVPLTPKKCAEVMATWPHVRVVVQSSPLRSFTDQEYRDLGIDVVDSVSDCDVLLGVKEVPKADLLPDKTYLFFSHTIKAQPANRDLLRTVLSRNIRLIDYETLTDTRGARVVAFGHYAGIVGAYNGLLVYGRKHGLYELKPAHRCRDLEELYEEFYKLRGALPASTKIAVTGTGRVGKGAAELRLRFPLPRIRGASLRRARIGRIPRAPRPAAPLARAALLREPDRVREHLLALCESCRPARQLHLLGSARAAPLHPG